MIKSVTTVAIFLASTSASAMAMGGSSSIVNYESLQISDYDSFSVSVCAEGFDEAVCRNAIINHDESEIAFSAPINITSGGEYSGNWKNDDPTKCAVEIRTNDPVVIKDSYVIGSGGLICHYGTDLEVYNTVSWGTGQYGRSFLFTESSGNINIHNNIIDSSRGSHIYGDNIVTFSDNFGHNIKKASTDVAHFVQIVDGDVGGSVISDNTVINTPSASTVEDTISVYNARGTESSPIRITRNRIYGAYPANALGTSYSGGGIIVDGSANATNETASQYVIIENNVVMNTTNYGIAIAAGHNNAIRNNLVVSSGIINGDTPLPSQNVGIYVWNVYGQSSDVYFQNSANNNRIHWARGPSLSSRINNYLWLPNCDGNCQGNIGVSGAAYERTSSMLTEKKVRVNNFGR